MARRDAGYVGRSKLARSVVSAIGDEMEQRRLETRGGERAMTPFSKVEFDATGDELVVKYKAGRKKHEERGPLLSWEDAVAELHEADAPLEPLELAIHFPHHYWLCAYHHQGKVEAALKGATKRACKDCP